MGSNAARQVWNQISCGFRAFFTKGVTWGGLLPLEDKVREVTHLGMMGCQDVNCGTYWYVTILSDSRWLSAILTVYIRSWTSSPYKPMTYLSLLPIHSLISYLLSSSSTLVSTLVALHPWWYYILRFIVFIYFSLHWKVCLYLWISSKLWTKFKFISYKLR